jgi:hypothetical protein
MLGVVELCISRLHWKPSAIPTRTVVFPLFSQFLFFFFNFLARHHYLVFAGSFGVLLRQGRKPEYRHLGK